MSKAAIDPHFRVEVLSQSPIPQQSIYAAMHQDYSESFVYDELDWKSADDTSVWKGISWWEDQFPGVGHRDGLEAACGDRVIKNLLNGDRGHYGPLEHPQIILNCGWFPHSTMQQLRTHRVGVSFDVQSFRYTGARIGALATAAHESWTSNKDEVLALCDSIFYLRPVGAYSDRQGSRYQYIQSQRLDDLEYCVEAACLYQERIALGFSEEHARGLIPFDVRQHWVMSANVRSLMHILDLRWKLDAQLEAQQLCDLIFPHFQAWVPSIANWYEANRAKKARLSP